MESSTIKPNQQQLSCPQLPLAVYREVAAHLRQVAGVDTSLIMRSLEHDRAEKFDYDQSQIAALQISYAENISATEQEQVAAILDYYAQRYSPWQD
ncbi:MAG: hypothetical protein ACFCU7_10445 [Pleurocapsa sp.]